MSGQTPQLLIHDAVKAYEIERLGFGYETLRRGSSGENSYVVKGLTFDVASGELLGIIGPNGSGKSSLLKLLARVLRPQAGTIRLCGSSLATLPQEDVARYVAYVPQQFHPLFPYTVLEMVLMGRFPFQRGGMWKGFGWESAHDHRVAWEIMKTMRIDHVASRPFPELSGGERQGVLIARALAQEPRVLLLDEPTAFLDLNHQLEICRLLRAQVDQQGLTILLVSHDLNLASQYCDRLLLLREGRSVMTGVPGEVLKSNVLESVYGCPVLIDEHPDSGRPRVSMPGVVR